MSDTDVKRASGGPTWRVIGGICLTMIGTLLLMIYSNLNARIDKNEASCTDAHERVKSVETSQKGLEKWLERVENKIDKALDKK